MQDPYAGWERANRYVDRSSWGTWSSSRPVAGGTWAVTCWKDKVAAPNGIMMVPVGVVAIQDRVKAYLADSEPGTPNASRSIPS